MTYLKGYGSVQADGLNVLRSEYGGIVINSSNTRDAPHAQADDYQYTALSFAKDYSHERPMILVEDHTAHAEENNTVIPWRFPIYTAIINDYLTVVIF